MGVARGPQPYKGAQRQRQEPGEALLSVERLEQRRVIRFGVEVARGGGIDRGEVEIASAPVSLHDWFGAGVTLDRAKFWKHGTGEQDRVPDAVAIEWRDDRGPGLAPRLHERVDRLRADPRLISQKKYGRLGFRWQRVDPAPKRCTLPEGVIGVDHDRHGQIGERRMHREGFMAGNDDDPIEGRAKDRPYGVADERFALQRYELLGTPEAR